MKLIIDIPEEVIDDMKELGFIPEQDNEELCKAIDNGTPIPDNATICNIEQIRDEIEHVIDYTYDSTDYDKALYNGAYKDGLYEALDIIDKYTKGADT